MENHLQQFRDRAINKVKTGTEHYNNNQDYDGKNKGYQLFVSGIEDLISYQRQEQNQEIVKMLKPKIKDYLTEANGMKAYLNSIQPQKIQPPSQNNQNNNQNNQSNLNNQGYQGNNVPEGNNSKIKEKSGNEEGDKFNQMLKETILSEKPNVKWDDIAGLENAKKTLQEAVVLPIKFPQIFTGTRTPWKGILFYGPPGTGKSYLAKACATECDATFFNISAADLISKWVGESEKLIKQLFKMAREQKPSIIFIDEVDSMTGNREGGGGGGDSSSRIKTQFLIEMQGVGHDDTGVLVLGATNIPWGLDPAIRRRIYIPLPEYGARRALMTNLLKQNPNSLTDDDIDYLAQSTQGFSGADMSIFVRDASYEPLRKCQRATRFKKIQGPKGEQYIPCAPSDPLGKSMSFMDLNGDQLKLPDLDIDDFINVLSKVKPSVGEQDIIKQLEFTNQFGQEG